jgi:hypothetical protein
MNKNETFKNTITETAVCLLFLMLSFLQLPVMADSGKEKHSEKLVTYPAPAGEALSADYVVKVNGKPVDVYLAKTQHHDKKYSFAYFNFSGEVEIRVTSSVSLSNVVILPESCGIKPSVRTTDLLAFTAQRPFKISIERDGENSPLLLFGNPLEENAPKQGDPNVIYYGPGIHKPGKISLTSNQTLYVAGGAVVKGGIEAKGDNIRILGPGILDGSDYPHADGPTVYMLTLEKCNNALIRDVIIRGSWLYTIAPCGCNHVTIDNVKICGSRVDNDDGIDPINSNDVIIHDCFLRTDDDCIATKGIAGYNNKKCENITITDCSFWTDRANIFRIAYESEADTMQNITARNIDVLHCVGDNRTPETFWSNWIFYIQPSNGMPMSNLLFEDIRINASGDNNNLIKILPMRCGCDNEPGLYVKGCVFRNIQITGKAGGKPGMIYIDGADAERMVENVTFENVSRFGTPVSDSSPDIMIGHYSRNIRFLNDK